MDMEQLYSYVPRELVTFVLVTLFSLLIGLSQRRISLKREGETTLFGTDRTFTFIGLLALYLRPYGYASVYGRWSGIGIAVGIKLLCKAITISCFWCNYHHYCPDYLLYGSYRSYPTFLVLCHGSCDCAPAD